MYSKAIYQQLSLIAPLMVLCIMSGIPLVSSCCNATFEIFRVDEERICLVSRGICEDVSARRILVELNQVSKSKLKLNQNQRRLCWQRTVFS
jgi:hypothetical protein